MAYQLLSVCLLAPVLCTECFDLIVTWQVVMLCLCLFLSLYIKHIFFMNLML